jgi:hypothetical protein
MEHVAVPEPSHAGGGVRIHVTHDGTRALPLRKAGSRFAGPVAAPKPSRMGCQTQYHGTHGSAWSHAMLPTLALSFYTGVPGL